MNKNAIKRFATEARRELISRVSQKALQYGISENGIDKSPVNTVTGRLLTQAELSQRDALANKIRGKGYQQVIEEVSYTWFNRFSALRFMEVNGYLPTHVRVFTDENNRFKPQIIAEAMHIKLDGLDMDKVYMFKESSDDEALFKYLIIAQCNSLNAILPGMFQQIEDYTELLFPDNLLREGSVIHQMIELIPEEDWKEQVQIIGWLYQYYNSEKKDEVFASLKKNIKITKENIPAATQLFTPDWIVRYMVENSLGRLWIEGHPSEELRGAWKYYLEEAEQEPEVQSQLDEIREEYKKLRPEELLCIDPCAGSGHILCYLFDVLLQIYESYGIDRRRAVSSIVANNLYGLDIDERAAQLAYFSIMMKACQYDKRFLSRGVKPHVYAIVESNNANTTAIDYYCGKDDKLRVAMNTIIKEMHDAKEYGSIITVTDQDWDMLYDRFDEIAREGSTLSHAVADLLPLVQVAEALAKKYHIVVTNPPYLGTGVEDKLSNYMKKEYPDSKGDLFAIFIEVCGNMLVRNGYQGMITMHSWMFLSSYEKLREKLLTRTTINMAHLGARAFEEIGGEVVQTTSFVMHKAWIKEYKATYCRLIEPTTQDGKEEMFLAGENRYEAKASNFSKIPGSPVAYWASNALISTFNNYSVADIAKPRQGLATGDNDRFLKYWYEPYFDSIKTNASTREEAKLSRVKWFPCNKGGSYRKWFGNNDYVVNWQNDGEEIKSFRDENGKQKSRPQNVEYYFQEGITWSTISSYKLSMRYSPEGHLFETKGSMCFPNKITDIFFLLALMNSSVVEKVLSMISPTLDFHEGPIGKTPVIDNNFYRDRIDRIVEENIQLSKSDWDSFETSWDFACHPLVALSKSLRDATGNEATMEYYYGELIPVSSPIELSYMLWQGECNERFNQLKANEEELNRIFIDIYGLQDELTPEVSDKDVTVRRADLTRDIKSFISYAVGCMLGRYSLNVQGLAYAGGEWNAKIYSSFPADKDNVIPICDDEYFDDDIVARFVTFVQEVYGEETLADNLEFIAKALGGSGQPRDVIRNYFLNDFYQDHCKIYQKRPIYWLFDSGKKNGFKCLIYMHRYRPDTIARIRTDYVHEQQARYRTAIMDLEKRIEAAAASEQVRLKKALKALNEQAEEIHFYEEKIHHLADQMIEINLDDGVKHNYAKFQDVLANIR